MRISNNLYFEEKENRPHLILKKISPLICPASPQPRNQTISFLYVSESASFSENQKDSLPVSTTNQAHQQLTES